MNEPRDLRFLQWPFRFFTRQPEGDVFRRGFGVCFDTMRSSATRAIVVVTCPVPLNLLFGWAHKTYWTIRCGARCRSGRVLHEFFHTEEARKRDAMRRELEYARAFHLGWHEAMTWLQDNAGKSDDEMYHSRKRRLREMGVRDL